MPSFTAAAHHLKGPALVHFLLPKDQLNGSVVFGPNQDDCPSLGKSASRLCSAMTGVQERVGKTFQPVRKEPAFPPVPEACRLDSERRRDVMRCRKCQAEMQLLQSRTLPELEGRWHLRTFGCRSCGTVLGPVVQTCFPLEPRTICRKGPLLRSTSVSQPW